MLDEFVCQQCWLCCVFSYTMRGLDFIRKRKEFHTERYIDFLFVRSIARTQGKTTAFCGTSFLLCACTRRQSVDVSLFAVILCVLCERSLSGSVRNKLQTVRDPCQSTCRRPSVVFSVGPFGRQRLQPCFVLRCCFFLSRCSGEKRRAGEVGLQNRTERFL